MIQGMPQGVNPSELNARSRSPERWWWHHKRTFSECRGSGRFLGWASLESSQDRGEVTPTPVEISIRIVNMKKRLKLVQGSLDLLVLQAVSENPIHGYGIMAWIKATGGEEIELEEGALYHALHRLDRKGFIKGRWQISPDTGRKAKFYSLTKKGVAQLAEETAQWEGYIRLLQRVMSSG